MSFQMISMSMVFLVICMHCAELAVGSMYVCNCDRTPNDIFMHVQDFLIPLFWVIFYRMFTTQVSQGMVRNMRTLSWLAPKMSILNIACPLTRKLVIELTYPLRWYEYTFFIHCNILQSKVEWHIIQPYKNWLMGAPNAHLCASQI
jgi:hypothetical protein